MSEQCNTPADDAQTTRDHRSAGILARAVDTFKTCTLIRSTHGHWQVGARGDRGPRAEVLATYDGGLIVLQPGIHGGDDELVHFAMRRQGHAARQLVHEAAHASLERLAHTAIRGAGDAAACCYDPGVALADVDDLLSWRPPGERDRWIHVRYMVLRGGDDARAIDMALDRLFPEDERPPGLGMCIAPRVHRAVALVRKLDELLDERKGQ